MHIVYGIPAFIVDWLLRQRPEEILLSLMMFALAALAGSLLTEKDPAGAILRSLEKRGAGFILGTLGVGFVAEMLREIVRGR
jgi:hypothetical protein